MGVKVAAVAIVVAVRVQDSAGLVAHGHVLGRLTPLIILLSEQHSFDSRALETQT